MSYKLIFKNSIFLYIRLIATMFIGIFTSRFVLSALGASDYGLYNIVGGIVSMMAFVNSIMVSTTYRYIAFELGKTDGDVNKVFNTSLAIHIAISMIVVVIAFTVGLYYINNFLVVAEGKLADALFTFSFSILNTVCIILGTPFQGLLVAKEKFSVTVPIEIFTKLITLVTVLLLPYLHGNHLRIYVVLITLINMLNPFLYFWYCLKKFYESVKWKINKSREDYKSMLGFSGWIMVSAAAGMGENQGSAMIINRFFGTVLNASFGIANQVNSMVQMFSRSLGQAVVPQITKSYSAGDHDRSRYLVILASKYSFFLMLVPMLPILLETEFIMKLWLKEVPPYTTLFVILMLIKSLILCLEAGVPSIISASGRLKYFHIATGIISLVGLPLAYYLLKVGHSPYIISYVYIATSLFSVVVDFVLLKLVLNYDVSDLIKRSVLKMLAVFMIVSPLFLVNGLFPDGLWRFFILSFVSEILLLSSIYFVGMEPFERDAILKYSSIAYKKIRRGRV